MSKEWARNLTNPVVRWIYLTGRRRRVAAVLSLLFVVLAALLIESGLVYVGPGSNFSTVLSSGMLSGLLTLLTVTLSINQLILSRLFGSAGALSDQLEGTLDYRRSVEAIADVAVSPNEPSAFLTFLSDTLKRRLGDFRREAASTAVTFEAGDDPEAYTSAVSDYAEHLSTAEKLDDPFKVLVLVLGEDYAEHLDTTREFQAKYGQRFPDETAEALNDSLELLKAIATMRQFFKTLTLQQELARLSRGLIYTGVPAVLVTYFLSSVYTSAADMPTAIDPAFMPIVVAVATGVILSPLAVLVASLLRIATVSLYSVSVGTFTPPQESFDSD